MNKSSCDAIYDFGMSPHDSLLHEELRKGGALSIIRVVDLLVEHAYVARSSDIHLDPRESGMYVRQRTDGILHDVHVLPAGIESHVIARLKILCGLRTDEHQASQDGRFRVMTSTGGSVDVRVSIMPTYHGENAVLRILCDQSEEFTLESLGFTLENREKNIARNTKASRHGPCDRPDRLRENNDTLLARKNIE